MGTVCSTFEKRVIFLGIFPVRFSVFNPSFQMKTQFSIHLERLDAFESRANKHYRSAFCRSA